MKELAIGILDDAIEENPCHTDGTTREVWVIVQTLTDFNTCWWVDVTSEQREDIILEMNQKHNHQSNHPSDFPLKIKEPMQRGQRKRNGRHTAPPCRALMMRLRSGGRAPALLARAASSLGYGGGR